LEGSRGPDLAFDPDPDFDPDPAAMKERQLTLAQYIAWRVVLNSSKCLKFHLHSEKTCNNREKSRGTVQLV
jgi:hypothetical protein